MPIYEYECCSCRKVFEVLQRISEKPLDHCPDCHGSVTKLVSMSAFHLKGGGWYADGYSNKPGDGETSGVKENSGGNKLENAAVGKESKPENTAGGKKENSSQQSQVASAG
jgi:putative FmdB family regulatory protein